MANLAWTLMMIALATASTVWWWYGTGTQNPKALKGTRPHPTLPKELLYSWRYIPMGWVRVTFRVVFPILALLYVAWFVVSLFWWPRTPWWEILGFSILLPGFFFGLLDHIPKTYGATREGLWVELPESLYEPKRCLLIVLWKQVNSWRRRASTLAFRIEPERRAILPVLVRVRIGNAQAELARTIEDLVREAHESDP